VEVVSVLCTGSCVAVAEPS